jgi:hypothetical protein
MSYELVIYDKRPDEHLAVVTINQPDLLKLSRVPERY